MNIKDLTFCEEYENKLKYEDLLCILDKALTDKGKQELKELNLWLTTNIDKYLTLIG